MTSPQTIAAGAAVGGFALVLLGTIRERKAATTLLDGAYEVEAQHIAFLNEMMAKYKIPSIDKAVRILLQFSKEFDKKEVFHKKRCNTCGGKKDKKILACKIYGAQKDFMCEMQAAYKVKTLDKVLRCMLEYAQREGDRDMIFQTVRCKTCS
mmetsp:Transcript_12298/g.30113  ORF Transcript_12298/g.30113 Transcript_12298/m.30113 type:complete len:152 (+) Transcript_12298:31-486(+)|eukprot:CAMPEP_0206243762 /NCGR_PEP_ID=MMETSP0047_2-20121206/17782_1 /ASSEMBLY_ACC=CAM_ASM_000192 /TAXON_ID=195065 /ORGANISM="Chroomonas mesostigmatica_cf, Strain CCMP1168" /LENGTH=151 /DNA_ID=CAMNT_0053668907 /DNA_START=6 /DNA_END=461 /DNA_ORIENTATION=+